MSAFVEKLNDEVARVVKTPESTKRFETLGLDVIAIKPAEFSHRIDVEIDKWGKVVKAAKLKIE